MTQERYSAASLAFHWAMAAAMIAGFVLGQVMEDMPRGPEKLAVMGWHVLVGATVAALLVPRLVARRRGAPPLPETMPAWERRLAKAGHAALYLATAVLVTSGPLALLSGGRPFPVLDLVTVPPVFASEGLHKAMEVVHGTAAKVFLILLILHVAAALWHAVRRDGIIRRMLPGG